MLELTVTMRRMILALLAVTLFLSAAPVMAQQEVWISAPTRGEAVQGSIHITGYTAVEGFTRAEVSFAYTVNPTGTWFLLASLDQPVDEALLATWDTSLITDGSYALRLQVWLNDGNLLENQVTGIRVQNTAPVLDAKLPADNPVTTAPPPVEDIDPTAVNTILPELEVKSPLPDNPAAFTRSELVDTLVKGAGGSLALLGLLGLYLALRRLVLGP